MLLGLALPNDRAHAPNERFHLPNLWSGIATSVWFLAELASIQSGRMPNDDGRMSRCCAGEVCAADTQRTQTDCDQPPDVGMRWEPEPAVHLRKRSFLTLAGTTRKGTGVCRL